MKERSRNPETVPYLFSLYPARTRIPVFDWHALSAAGQDVSSLIVPLQKTGAGRRLVVMDAPLEKIVNTDLQGIYSVVVCRPPVTVYALRRNGVRQKMAVWNEEKAYQFVAVTNRTVFVGGEIGRMEQVFDAALSANMNEAAMINAEGEPLVEPDDKTADSCAVTMAHAVWCTIPATANSVRINPSDKEGVALSLQLLFSPSADLSLGWLISSDLTRPVYWPFGEPLLVGGYRYCITLVQLPDMIVANMTPLGAV